MTKITVVSAMKYLSTNVASFLQLKFTHNHDVSKTRREAVLAWKLSSSAAQTRYLTDSSLTDDSELNGNFVPQCHTVAEQWRGTAIPQ
jgi:hypothetical protein